MRALSFVVIAIGVYVITPFASAQNVSSSSATVSAPVTAPPASPPRPTEPVLARAKPLCRPFVQTAFIQLAAISLKQIKNEQDAAKEVLRLFGSLPVPCEAGTYGEFLDQFADYAGGVFRPESAKDQVAQWLICMALLKQAPKEVPFEEGARSKLLLDQMRANLHAVADDVKQSRLRKANVTLIDKLLAAVDVQIAPTVGAAPSLPPAEENVIQVKIPSKPLPKWAVILLYEAKGLLATGDAASIKSAREKVQQVVDWINNPYLTAPSVLETQVVKVPQGLMTETVVQSMYELADILKQYEMWTQTGTAKAAKTALQKELEEAKKRVDAIVQWIES